MSQELSATPNASRSVQSRARNLSNKIPTSKKHWSRATSKISNILSVMFMKRTMNSNPSSSTADHSRPTMHKKLGDILNMNKLIRHLAVKSKPSASSADDEVRTKKALLIGVAYNNIRGHMLKGPINDVKVMRNLLINHFGYQEENVCVLSEEENKPAAQLPTKNNIQKNMKWLVEGCEEGDYLVFYFSGHGVRQPDFGDEESDGFDESICPLDFMQEGVILDDEIYATIVLPLAKGVTLHAIVDACHSGTILDLAYLYNIQEKKWEENKKKINDSNNTNRGLAISISACHDNQVAADTDAFSDANETSGAMTYILQDILKKKKGITYGDLFDLIDKFIEDANQQGCLPARIVRKVLKYNWFLQKPQLCASEQFPVYERQFRL